MNKVIEIETEETLQYFDESEAQKVRDSYLAIGNWESVMIDTDGDILLFKELRR